ncbi:YIF1-domain-containing protein [Lactarius deliciosus]|nr:YIF1-domain-containing protein [Lactarius deliciosus]
MAFVTYILLAALQSGLRSRFHPEIFGPVATKAIVVVLFDFLFAKIGCYLLGVQGSGPIVDLLAYGGYKFVVKLNIFQSDRNTPGRACWVITHTILSRLSTRS